MSAKWRALQHRHRYTYNAVAFPPYFIRALNQTPDDSSFFVELKHLISLNSTYAQLEHAKNLASAFSNLLSNPNSDEKLISCAAKFYLEILFLENSVPLHRTLASALAKCKNFQSSIGDCYRQLCEEYGGENGKGKRFCVSRAALSMLSTPKLGYLVKAVEQCAVLVGLDVVFGLRSVVSETNDSSRPSPVVMEQCQEALSCMYYLLQRFPTAFYDRDSKQNDISLEKQWVIEMILTTILSILKSQAFARDCLVAAGVSFCTALLACLSAAEYGLIIMEGIFHQTSIVDLKIELDDVVRRTPINGDLVGEISNFSALSRLCLIRGILTASARTILDTRYIVSKYNLNGVKDSANDVNSVKTILYDGILPELCNYCENPTDSHFNFHALTVMQICLQQIKTLQQGENLDVSENYDPIPEEMGARILRIVWNNLEDPLSQTVKQVHLIFDLYLDIQASLKWAESSEKIKLFLRKIATDLLRLGPRCKGRYVPLASLTKRLGAKTILDMNPNLLYEMAKAYIDDDVCCAATTFLKCFLECLRDEYWSSDGVESGYTKYRRHCLQPFLCGLASGLAKLRTNLNTYALPVLLELDGDSIFPMLALIGIGPVDEGSKFAYTELGSMDVALGLENQVAVLVSLLKICRVLALIEGDIDWQGNSSISPDGIVLDTGNSDLHCVVFLKGIEVKVPVKWLILALTHEDESLRIDAAESLFFNSKTSSLPSSLELNLMRRAMPLNMRCCSTAFVMKWTSLFRKFFSRVRTALERQLKMGTWQPLASGDINGVSFMTGAEISVKHRAENLYNFMKWLSCFLLFSCYPSAPYERKIMAMELILTMLSFWSILLTVPESPDSVSSVTNIYPYSKGFALPDSTLLLVGSIVDSWDRLRENSFRILLYFPTPLPGIYSPDMVREAIIWAKKLVCSPRVRESDAGALTLRLIFRKYVLELRWIVRPSCNVVFFHPGSEMCNAKYENCKSSSPALVYVISLIDWLLSAVEDGENNLSEACKNSFVHGILLTLRYTFEEMDWNSDIVLHCNSDMKHALERLLELVTRITSLALWVVSADALHLPDNMEDIDDDAFLLEIPDEIVPSAPVDVEAQNSDCMPKLSPPEQIVMVGCWLAMKEVSLLLGTIIRKIPLPTSDESGITFGNDADVPTMASDAMLDIKQLETIGNHFLEVLLKMKHNGAIDKTRAGFTALCNRLLCSNDPRLCKLTESWMEQLMERTVAKGQTVDDLLRRSAGIPAAFTALFLSEPEGTPKRLLPWALRWLIDIAKKSLTDQTKLNSSNSDLSGVFSPKSSQTTANSQLTEMNGDQKISKLRDEGVVPTVHTFNVLRAAFNDTNLATDTSGFAAEAIIISIQSFSSSYWEVRNSACLAYTALVRRMIGFLNVQKRESARRAITGLEFFHRYPSLHPFVLNELKVATELLLDGSSECLKSNLKSVVHPSLCPMLILLSRLKPSPITSETGDSLDPFLFMPFIRRCSVQNNFRIRLLASRAITGLVSNEKLQVVLLNIASELPCVENQIMAPDSSTSLDLADRTSGASFNLVHGILLQLSSLLDTNCRNLADSFKKDMILNGLIQILAKCSWIGRPQLCRCPTLNGCFLKLLDNMLSLARTCQTGDSIGAIWNLLWELSSECLDLELSDYPPYFDPTISELREQAAISYFNCVFQTSEDIVEDALLMPMNFSSVASYSLRRYEMEVASTRFQERLTHSMSDLSYEVRIATMKWLLLFLRATESGINSGDRFYSDARKICLSNINLQERLMKLLATEKHHKCVHYILKILYTWNQLEWQDDFQEPADPRYICDMDCNSVFQLWETLVSLLRTTRHAKTRQTLVCCMGICIKRISSLSLDLFSSEPEKMPKFSQSDLCKKKSDFYKSTSYFVNLIEQYGDASEPVNMRKAAAESMVASGLLAQSEVLASLVSGEQFSNGNLFSHIKPEEDIRKYAGRILDLWLMCIKLLEDEDVGIRKRLALEVQKCLAFGKPREHFSAGIAPRQVEKVIALCFEHLSSIFSHWPDYLDYLCCWVLNAANNANYVISSGDLVRRVFDKEIDNHHEEKLFICQICCSQLEKILTSKFCTVDFSNKSGSRDFLHGWRSRFRQQLVLFASDHIKKLGGVEWIGGVGNHKDSFLPIYANLLMLHALSNCIFRLEPESSKSMLSEVLELGEAIHPFLRNPLVSNLYLLVVKSHEKFFGATDTHWTQKWREDGSIWDEFDPYFLLE
ncbi:Hypothetical predicted protein [Olea europaea subsp. europaea]|uniref:DUF2428 domain-containing protein n=1 Tax=Olea europaea subsp. europaea TaxID=158383 RepID=A0A8S0U5M3_OLEEU|nr:Hypothetical predicted protein [Olea europaea subsp. europaea]